MAAVRTEGVWTAGAEAVALTSPELPEDPRAHPPHQHQYPQPATATNPELIEDLRNLRGWYEEANRLETQVAQLSAKASENEHRLAVARRQAAEARARKERAAASIPQLARSRKEIESRSSEIAAALQVEKENVAKRIKDNKGLRRSLYRLHQRLGYTSDQTDNIDQVLRQEAELEEAARVEEESLQQTIEGMGDVQEKMTKKVAEERTKRLQLREASRLKLERVEESQASLKQQLDDHKAVVEGMKTRLAEQEERTRAAQQELSASREVAGRAVQYLEQQQDAKRAMHHELLGVQRAHENLRIDLETTLAKLEEKSERESKAQHSWRLKHMERLDARIHARQQLDQDVVVAEDPLIHARGGC